MSSNRKVIAELKRIAKANGGQLKPADVVDAARSKDSVLHSKFEWNDGLAAERYRLWQARQLISVTVEYIPATESTTRVFVSLSPDRQTSGGGYRATVDTMTNAQHRAILLQDALDEMRRFQQKFAELRELAEVFAAMKQFTQRRSRKKSAEISQ